MTSNKSVSQEYHMLDIEVKCFVYKEDVRLEKNLLFPLTNGFISHSLRLKKMNGSVS